MANLTQPLFLPMSREEMNSLGWDELDVLLVSGDAYVDSHAFGVPLLGRWLVAHGYRVGLVCQPGWESTDDFTRMGRPRLFAGVSAGALDSLVAHYTAFRKKRHDDAYTPGGKEGARPNRAVIVYTGLVRRAFPGLPVAIGGIEASLRRATHYDFWSDSARRSVLLDSKADILLYGMGERSVLELADLFASSADARLAPAAALAKAGIRGGAYAVHPDNAPEGTELPSHEAIVADPPLLVKTALAFERQMLNGGPRLTQRSGGRAVVFEPPAAPLDEAEMDQVYSLPFTRRAHPSYDEPIPAVAMLETSVTSHRGCAGGCSFCSLALHQGRTVQSRSGESIKAEIREMAKAPDWHGSITDIGGPSANMWRARCAADPAACQRQSCLFPKRCRHFKAAQEEQITLLRQVAEMPGVSHVRIASGVRHDLAIESDAYMAALAGEFTGGQLKIAPEHIAERVLRLMRKPGKRGLETFLKRFAGLSREAGKEQYVIPYLMSAFPGTTDDDMRELSQWLERRGFRPKQVQCFIPTPGTVASAMFFAKVDADGRPIHVARTDGERLFQHRILLPETEQRPSRPAGDRRQERGGQSRGAFARRGPKFDKKPGKAGGFGKSSDKPGRPDRSGKPDKPYGSDRPSRPDGSGKSYKSGRPDGPYGSDRSNRPDRPGKPYKPGRPDKPYGSDRPSRPDGSGKPYRSGRPDGPYGSNRSDRPDRSGKPGRPGGSDRPDRPYRSDKAGRPNRPNRPDRGKRGGRDGGPRP